MPKKISKTTKTKFETVNVDDLVHDPANVRLHDERNLDAIMASLARFGQQKPIVVGEDNVVLAGNGTLAAAKQLKWSKLDVMRTSLTGSDAIAYAIADNRTAELATWDKDGLAQILASLQNDTDVDHLVTGYTDDEIKRLINSVVGEEADAAEFKQEYLVLVNCVNEQQQGEVFDMCKKQNYEAKLLS